MSTIPYVVAIIQKDAVEHLPVVVGAHEIPILVAVHGESQVFIDENADLPEGLTEVEFADEDSVIDEFARLDQRYGRPKDSVQSFAQLVFRDADNLGDALDRYSDGGSKARRTPAAKKVQGPKAKSGAEKATTPDSD